METILYMGSKKELVFFIEKATKHFFNGETPNTTFFDVFCGSGRVAYHFRHKYQITASDKQLFTKVLINSYLRNPYPKEDYEELVAHLNKLPLEYFEKTDKWYSKTYSTGFNEGSSIGLDGKPKVWQEKNAVKIDMIRHQIAEWWRKGSIDEVQRDVLLLSLILAINKISNVVGHQNGYLREWCKHSGNDLTLKVPKVENKHSFEHKVLVGSIFDLDTEKYDIAYFDPPYGTNNKSVSISTVGRYTTFYHLWNTLVANNKPTVWGMANKPVEIKGKTFPLEMNVKAIIIPKFIRLIEEIDCKTVIFSYSNQGLLTPQDFEKVFEWGGCDMDSFTLYRTPHKVNNQTNNARKEGAYINREGQTTNLYEYLFIAKKKENHIRNTVIGDGNKEYEDIGFVNKWLLYVENRDYLPQKTFTYIDGQFLTVDQELGKEERPELSMFDLLGLE